VVVNLVGLAGLVAGLALLQNSSVAFTAGGVLGGIVSQLGTTLPAAVAVFLATAMNVGAGAVLVRIIRWSPFGSIAELALSGLVAAIVLDAVLLFAVGPFGLFRPLTLAIVNLVILAGGVFVRPWLIPGERRLPSFGPLGWVLIAIVWSAPLLLQLASPVVPFLDVLPNHVAPVEHLRTYGTWETLAVSPSPIYGPSRLFIGYVALLGTLSTLTALPAALAVSAFALPLSILIAFGAAHLAQTLAGPADGPTTSTGRTPASSAGYWALLTVPLTFTFLRLPDARATVLVFAPVAIALAILVSRGAWGGRSRSVVLAAALGASVLVHPLAGAFAVATVGLVGLLSPERFRLAMAGVIGAAIVALPQAVIMVGLAMPAWAALPALPAGLLVAAWLSGPAERDPATAGRPRALARDFGWPAILLAVVVVAGGVAIVAAVATSVPHAIVLAKGAATTTLLDWGVLSVVAVIGFVLVRSLDAVRVLGAAILVGAAALAVGEAFPGDSLLVQSIHFEVPKSAGYWLPWFAAIAGALGLAAIWDRRGWPQRLRVGLIVAFVLIATIDPRPDQIEAVGIEQHRYADSLAIALHEAETGYWVGYPDSRTIVDGPRQDLLAAVQAEQAAGRMGPSTTLLHVAPSFQQWDATPLGVFAGVIETDATKDPEHSVHTVGGRLEDVADLPALLRQGFPYVVVEGYPSGGTYVTQAKAAGYQVIWQNNRAVLLRL
jgi:hypothetical protein